MKYSLRFLFFICCLCMSPNGNAQQITTETHPSTGAISQIKIAGDSAQMNWILKTDGSQYPWIRENYGWGLGYFTETIEQQTVKRAWVKPVKSENNGMDVSYKEGYIRIDVKRKQTEDSFIEMYTFTNEGHEEVALYDIGIHTPFNDNYPNAQQSLNCRTHAHIWAGGSSAYVNALRMGAYPPHLGLVVTEGSIKSYEIWERGRKKENSHTRGVITLNMPDLVLRPSQSYILSWELFSHTGNDDFYKKLLNKGSVIARSDKYVFEKNDIARVEFESAASVEKATVTKNGMPIPAKRSGNTWIVETPMKEAGEVHFDFHYGVFKQTQVNCLVVTNIDSLIHKRVNFIHTRQQMNNPNDPRNGAYMVYDNELDKIYLNDTPNANPVDRDEGAERVGMGILLAKQYLLTKDPVLKESLLRYAKFIRNGLQTKDYVTYSSVGQKDRNRAYNYVWVASFYFQMYKITKEKQYASDGYQTMQSLYRQFGHGFYAIDIPVQLSLEVLKEAGLNKEHKQLIKDYNQTADVFCKNSVNYPKSEVNYEQVIVAPALTFLTQLYLETRIKKYLDEVEKQLPVLSAFNGFQPSFHLNDIAIRHWDGHWFGKREMFGDTFPHYWNTATAAAFYYYAKCTGDMTYMKRAENIVRNNLCLFFEDGRASCAYMYPYKINGIKAEFYDPYANDQDWALVFYLLVNKNI